MSAPAKRNSTDTQEKDLMLSMVQVFKSWFPLTITALLVEYAFKPLAVKILFKKRNHEVDFMLKALHQKDHACYLSDFFILLIVLFPQFF
ncbi:hypothetical protein ISN44_As12g017880 [Arabidopsis suecica]|uniref:Uncharacterized protein n=1 Tax=Arabidopsis suecica TaxID=45249 RepID=A0A8T1YK84_ARASU|nr:hypothetical protein ISN44_As12g017880 [Arabidopsis suecica]